MLLAYGTRAVLSPICRQVRAAGHEVMCVDSETEQLPAATQYENLLLQLTDLQRTRDALTQLPSELRTKTILMAQRPSQATLRLIADLPVACTMVTHEPVQPNDVLVAIQKQIHRDYDRIQYYVAKPTIVHRVTLTESSRRGEALDVLDRFCTQIELDPRLISQYLTIADEFITNAFYNAIVDEDGRRMYAHISRIEPVTLPVEKPVEIEYACDGRQLAVAVRDYYGSFDRHELVDHLSRALFDPQIRYGTAGAGLGLATALRCASQLVFNVVTRRYTQCIGLLDVVSSYREFLRKSKAFQIFYSPAAPRRSS